MNRPRSTLRTVGSLWFAAVLLMLLLVAMACATVFESMHGTQRALLTFYRSWWFETLLALLGINAAAAIILRYPFSRKKLGFLLTHASLIVILAGALISAWLGVDGQVRISAGQTVEHFNDLQRDALTINSRADKQTSSIVLDSTAFKSLDAVDQPAAPLLALGDIQITVQRYLPDSVWSRQVLDDDDHSLKPAVEVSLSPSGQQNLRWVFADPSLNAGSHSIAYRVVSDAEELARLVSGSPTSQPDSLGVVKVTCASQPFEFALEDCLDNAVPLGDSGYTVRVLRYLPHAVVGPDKQLINASDERKNPAIEVEIVGPAASEKRVAFAKFPGFRHAPDQLEEVDLTFVAAEDSTPGVPLEVLSGPNDELYVRFRSGGHSYTVRELSIGTPIKSPWRDWDFTVLRRLAHARVEWVLEENTPVRSERFPALLLNVSTPTGTQETWLRKFEPSAVQIDEEWYELIYRRRQVPLGFALTLNRFQVGTYPGGDRPRSYESQVTTLDPATGREQSHVISMNHPVKQGDYTLYQSSYAEQPNGPTVSFLSVARDPGQPVVFAGYIALMIGMAIIIVTRVAERRGSARLAASAAGQTGNATSASVPRATQPQQMSEHPADRTSIGV